jgi:hypothetical protein
MESFRSALERLTRNLVDELLAAVQTAAAAQLAERETKETRPKPTRIVRPSAAPVVELQEARDARPVVVRHFDIPVGQPRRRRRRVDGAAAPTRKVAPAPEPQVVKFEVVPHPERKGRRIVLTRIGNP